MYKLELNNEEFFELRALVEKAKVGDFSSRFFENSHIEAIATKLILSHCDVQEEARREAQAERYAANLHSRPEGA